MLAIAETLDERLHQWDVETAETVEHLIAEIIVLADHDSLGLLRSRAREQEVLDMLDEA